MAELIKLHSMPGSDMIEFPTGARHFNDYLAHGNRNYILSVSGAKWVKFWVSWSRVQTSAPSNIWHSWSQLSSAGNANGNYFARLDELIKAANDDGFGVILQVDDFFPQWSNVNKRNSKGTGGKPPEKTFPDSVQSDSPWGWWMSYLVCRYKLAVGTNPTGPTQSNLYGNPVGASLYGLEFCNEPNLNHPVDESACYAAEMFKTIEFIGAVHWANTSGSYGNIFLGPATADHPGSANAKNYDAFTRDVLSYLPAGWQPRVYMGWSHHNYEDIDSTLSGGTGSSRAERVRGRLHGGFSGDTNNPWRNGDRTVYISEGAARRNAPTDPQDLTTTQEQEQVNMTRTAFLRMRSLHNSTGGFPLYAQHALNDTPYNRTKYGTHRNFNASTWTPGQARPLAAHWRALPGLP